MVKRPQIYSVWSTPTPEDADRPQDLPAQITLAGAQKTEIKTARAIF